jgi:TM2 domain-containing membrane protein YozV
VIGVRSAALGALLALAVTIAYQGVVSLVGASGARDQPALILILLLSAFLGVLTAVVTRMLRLPGATAPTVLVLGWTLVPLILLAIPSAATQLFAGDAALSSGQALALATATVAAAVTLGVPAERR